jgi:hypothetical protein
MKKQFYIFSLILIAATVFNVSSLKAENKNPNQDYNIGTENSNGNECNYSNVSHTNGALKTDGAFGAPSPSTNLPINNGVVFLMMAGLIIGIATLKKYKSDKPVLVIR